ncbi:tol-pal system protein YbgF [Desulfonauticus submarinus]|uniref:Tol-pal system protein YbgF n=1 Tax=Desulfonauticus submarinus TaxID=206665 RepID=A0A1H0GH53_9BACT|nr:tol-pal system protein YbgF [Desulfonauticus submarinus]SDO06182.1 tol-pal system protein YbgF [Desulfonauticus submarinus]
MFEYKNTKASVLFISVLLSIGCSLHQPKQQNSKSLEWRMESLEENSLNFKHQLLKQKKAIDKNSNQILQLQQKVGNLESKTVLLEQKISKLESNAQNSTLTTNSNIHDISSNKTNNISVSEQESNLTQSDNFLYQKGLSLILANKLKKGRTVLNNILKFYPKSKLVPNALYWIGESYYGEGKYAKSILTFKRIVNSYPTHYKASHALLKIAYAYAELGDKENAKFYLKILLQDYPKSDVVAKAKKKLKMLQ